MRLRLAEIVLSQREETRNDLPEIADPCLMHGEHPHVMTGRGWCPTCQKCMDQVGKQSEPS